MTAHPRLSLVTLVLTPLLVALCSPAQSLASDWSPLTPPWAAPAIVRDISTFGATGLAAAGDDGKIAVSPDGGASWTVHAPAGFASSTFTAAAFSSATSGVVASGGVVLSTTDAGRTWKPPAFRGAAPAGQVLDIAMSGRTGYLVGAGGMIFATPDGGASWLAEASPTSADITTVAIAGDGTAVAGTDAGEVLVRSAGSWLVATTLADPVDAVAASADPTPGDGDPDLLVTAGPAFLGSDDDVTFAALPAAPATPHPALAWLGSPGRASLLGGPGGVGFWTPAPATWLPTDPAMTGAELAAAPGRQSTAYLLSHNGEISRTVSAGRQSATTTLSATSITVGAPVRFGSVVRIAAPGTAEIDGLVPGHSWSKVKSYAWSRELWGRSLTLKLAPTFTTEYRVRFRYGGAWITLSTSAPVTVHPKLIADTRRIVLGKGAIYRFRGSMMPALGGARVGLFTDRGGKWRSIAGNRSVRVSSRGTWTSRQFGTPKAETYHLRAFIAGTRIHGEAWSPIATVVVR
ncbi:MAG TPA: YCF48-related protein [Thermoleophilia bacterium]|nr:YCF48-related protein [Thermoleophilia bacterium]